MDEQHTHEDESGQALTQPKESTQPKVATFDMLMKKPQRVTTAEIFVSNDLGDAEKVVMKFKGITSEEYDALVAKHPPSREDKERNGSWNSKTFPPALVAACSYEPTLTEAQARELATNPDWSSGEFTDLFMAANRSTMGGLNIPFNDLG